MINCAEDYKIACEIRNYINAVSRKEILTDEIKEWIKWANKKTNWFEPTIDEESHIQLSDFEYEGEVQGTNKAPYHVLINTKHPKSSSCDCPFTNGNTICKHMVALFFAVSPEDLKDYEDWSENDYEDEYEEYDEEDYYDDYEYDRYGNYNKYKSNFIRPIFFDELLSNFVNNLSEEKHRDNYRKAVVYIEALYKLNDGKRIVDELIKKLKNSEYSRRIALFDEIHKVIINIETNYILITQSAIYCSLKCKNCTLSIDIRFIN